MIPSPLAHQRVELKSASGDAQLVHTKEDGENVEFVAALCVSCPFVCLEGFFGSFSTLPAGAVAVCCVLA